MIHRRKQPGRPLWIITIAVLATSEEVDRLGDALVATICPSPHHDGDCAIPWSMTISDASGLSHDEEALVRENIRLTNPPPPHH
jgi:hypothetical protein